MNIKLIIVLIALPFLSFSQKYKRKTFNYEKLKSKTSIECGESIIQQLEKSFIALDQNNSDFAVQNAKEVYENEKDCYHVYEAYSYALFRNGKWFESVEIIEDGIKKLGSVPELIKRKSEMSIEMAQLGTGQKNIDGNSVFKANSIEYDEEEFVAENYRSALLDLDYLIKKFNRGEEVFFAAKIHQILEEYDKSIEGFNQLLNDEEFKYQSLFSLAENYIALDKLPEAETVLNKILKDNPREGVVFKKLAEVYHKKEDDKRANEYQQKAIYYSNIPYFSNLEYSDRNYGILLLFGTNEHKASEKIEELNKLFEQESPDFTTDVCLMILKLHANHGNGVEERATEILGIIGQPAIEKVNQLFQQDVSTCTVTNLADVMAKVKDTTSWELMREYLPYIANMPMTLIPPAVPKKMILFNEDEGIREILSVVKPLLTEKKKEGNALAELSGFGQYVYYTPLKDVDQGKIIKIAKELDYTDEELELLQKKIE